MTPGSSLSSLGTRSGDGKLLSRSRVWQELLITGDQEIILLSGDTQGQEQLLATPQGRDIVQERDTQEHRCGCGRDSAEIQWVWSNGLGGNCKHYTLNEHPRPLGCQSYRIFTVLTYKLSKHAAYTNLPIKTILGATISLNLYLLLMNRKREKKYFFNNS